MNSRALPPKHLDFFENLDLTASIGSYLFVHAGIRPGLALAEQDEEDLVWIREPFLSSDLDHGVIVVHGHTPVDVPDVRPEPDQHRYRRGLFRQPDVPRSRRNIAALSQRHGTMVTRALQAMAADRRHG